MKTRWTWATLTAKGRLTLPKEVREALGLKVGGRIAFVMGADGRVTIEPATVDLLSLAGVLEPRRKGVTVDEMNEAIRRAGTRT